MNIGLVVHSVTGNTQSVVEKVGGALEGAGHRVTALRLEVEGGHRKGEASPPIVSDPDLSGYDALVLGSHVEAFGLAQAMQDYLRRRTVLKGKPLALVLTEQLPYKWMGGRSGLRRMSTLCWEAGGDVRYAGVVNWSNKGRDRQISELTEAVVRAF